MPLSLSCIHSKDGNTQSFSPFPSSILSNYSMVSSTFEPTPSVGLASEASRAHDMAWGSSEQWTIAFTTFGRCAAASHPLLNAHRDP
mmetsp:Transcript_62775/g.168214  ORF Transcript_62775/g.168214 Transcript_62775/m.168214 type:complete len:87 (+) Transcript_62775:275-535(+)